jgi:hypothetical protein
MTYENVIKSVHAPGRIVPRTDDEVNLRPKFECKVLVAHEVVHLDGFNNPEFCNALLRQDLV